MPFGKSRNVRQTLRLRFGGSEYVDIVRDGDPDGHETFAELQLLYRNGAGASLEFTPSGQRLLVNWGAVSTVQLVE